jgi:hypothetical protein
MADSDGRIHCTCPESCTFFMARPLPCQCARPQMQPWPDGWGVGLLTDGVFQRRALKLCRLLAVKLDGLVLSGCRRPDEPPSPSAGFGFGYGNNTHDGYGSRGIPI